MGAASKGVWLGAVWSLPTFLPIPMLYRVQSGSLADLSRAKFMRSKLRRVQTKCANKPSQSLAKMQAKIYIDSAPKEIRTQLHLHWLLQLQLQLQLRDSISSFSLQRQLSLNVHRTLARHVATQSLRPCGKETERNAAPKTDIYTVSPAPTTTPRPRPTRLQFQLGSILVHLVSRKKPTRHTEKLLQTEMLLPAWLPPRLCTSLPLTPSTTSFCCFCWPRFVRVNSFGWVRCGQRRVKCSQIRRQLQFKLHCQVHNGKAIADYLPLSLPSFSFFTSLSLSLCPVLLN